MPRVSMRVLPSATVFALFLVSTLTPLVSTATAEIEDLGHAGDIATFSGSGLGWWDLGDGTVLYASIDGNITVYSVNGNEYTETWSVDVNKTLYSGAFNPSTNRIAFGSGEGATIVSIDYEDILYHISMSGAVDGLAWDVDGDLWLINRNTNRAEEWTDNTPSGVTTSAHNYGITDVITLSDGSILTSARDKRIYVHDANGSLIQTLTDSSFELLKLGLSDDGNHLFSLTSNCRVDVHDTSTWIRLHHLNLCSNGQGRHVSQLGERLLIGTSNGQVFSLDITDFSQEQSFSISGEIIGFNSTSGEGVLILVAYSSSSEVHLLDADRDNDGVVDGLDVFPDDSTQDSDYDGDGFGDNPNGNNSDWDIDDPTQWLDTDGDGYGDNLSGNNPDAFPLNPGQWLDTDGDGYGDNKQSAGGDQFPEDSTQWNDTDYDGYGDNQEPGATNSDDCPNQGGTSWQDRDGCQDSDGDGWSDPGQGEEAHPLGNADAFPLNSPDQWRDTDGDGYGDNLTGYRGDACPSLEGTSTRAVLFDPALNRYNWIYRYGCIDTDGDGYDDNTESGLDADCTMVGNSSEWIDHDRDCIGSNSDYNDTDPKVQTFEDYCFEYPTLSECQSTEVPNIDSGNDSSAESEQDTMDLIKDFALYAGIIGGVMIAALALIVSTTKAVGTARAKRKPDAQYTHQDATRELDAWESGESFETRGGIDDQKGWEDEPLENTEKLADEDSLDMDEFSDASSTPIVDSDFEPKNLDVEITEDVKVESLPDEPVEAAPEPSSPAEVGSAPAEAPPLPAGGLPEGWTEDQWRWYGHQWLERHGQN